MKNFTFKNRFAFTMMELVFVIVVLGILAALALPRMERDLRQEAGDNILSAIRYTQHLAINDDKHSLTSPNWQRALWQIRFTTNNRYSIWSDIDMAGDIDIVNPIEPAVDPLTGKNLHSPDAIQDANESPDIFLGLKYGINNIAITGCANPNGSVQSAALSIAFDNFGRPFRGISPSGAGAGATNNYDRYVISNCTLTFQSPSFSTDLVIQVNRETGYAFIVGQTGS